MKIFAVCGALTVLALTHAFPQYLRSQDALNSLYDSVFNPILDEKKVSDITDVSISRGGQTITFTKGDIRFFAPVRGKIIGCVYRGHGTYTVTPPTEIERLEFERQTGKKFVNGSYTYAFDRAVLWFADSIFGQISPHCSFKEGAVQRTERDAVGRSVKYATDPLNPNSLYRIIGELLETRPEPYLMAHLLLDKDGNDLFLEYDKRRFEEVQVEQPTVGYSGGFNYWRDPICSFHDPVEYKDLSEYDLTQEDKRRVHFTCDSIDVTSLNGSTIGYRAVLKFQSLGDSPGSLLFHLRGVSRLRTVTTASGDTLPFLRNEKESSSPTLVVLPRQATRDYELTFDYEVEYEMYGRHFSLAPGFAWYPDMEFMDRRIFDMTFHIPQDLEVASAGRMIAESSSAGTRTVRYRTDEPDCLASFMIGEFKPTTIRIDSTDPPVTVYAWHADDASRAGHDLARSVQFYTTLFGKSPFTEFKAVDGPWGQTFPNFIFLPATREKVGGDVFSVSLGRSHEVSHAWWGYGMGWRSYHDQWLSEGFAHYSSLLHALEVLRQDQPFFDKLREWREQITGARKYAFGSGPAAGSVWLGYRTSSEKSPSDVSLVVYEKGAWVLHMIRMLMLDLQTLNEAPFKSLMKDFYTSFKGMDPGTDDFEHFVEKYMRTDMRWFFYEWVYRNEIPKYKVKYSSSHNSGGKWVMNIHVEQSGVPDTFKMFVPVEMKLKNGLSEFSRLFIDKPAKDFTYELEAEPAGLNFNIYESVLCIVEE
jgi:hypothetical protein